MERIYHELQLKYLYNKNKHSIFCIHSKQGLYFINVCTLSFYAHISRKCNKLLDLAVFFALWGSVGIKGVRKMLVKLTQGIYSCNRVFRSEWPNNSDCENFAAVIVTIEILVICMQSRQLPISYSITGRRTHHFIFIQYPVGIITSSHMGWAGVSMRHFTGHMWSANMICATLKDLQKD